MTDLQTALSQSLAIVKDRNALINALRPFVQAYERAADAIGDSDLYDEQPRSVQVTLGDCRKAATLLRTIDKP